MKTTALLALAALAASSFAQTPQLKVRGQLQYVHGINLGWMFSRYSTDLGLNPRFPEWGCGYNAAKADAILKDIKAMNVNTFRLWLHEDLEGLTFDANGRVNGLQAQFLANLDDFLTRANSYGLAAQLSLLNHNLKDQFGMTLPGGATIKNIMDESAARTAYIQNALVPLVNRYKNNLAVYSWDLINEGNWGTINGSYTLAGMRALGQEAAMAAKLADPSIQITLSLSQGWTMTDQNQHNQWAGGLGLTFYQYHQYNDTPNLNTPPAWLDRPLLLGEYGPYQAPWTEQKQNECAADYLQQAMDKGYAGAMGWMYWHSQGNGESIAKTEGGLMDWEATGWTIKAFGERVLTQPRMVYTDTLQNGWRHDPSGAAARYNWSGDKQVGTVAIRALIPSDASYRIWRATYPIVGTKKLRFWIKQSLATTMTFTYIDGANRSISRNFALPAGTWRQIEIPIGPNSIKSLRWSHNGNLTNTVLLDQIGFYP